MKLFSAIGLVVLIIALKVLMSDVVTGFEQTLLSFFAFAQATMLKAQEALQASNGFR